MVKFIRNTYTRHAKASLVSNNEPAAKHNCPICTDVLKDHAMVKPCGHVFDFDCIKAWILQVAETKRAQGCTCCRTKMKAI
jgi:hypothetical protein